MKFKQEDPTFRPVILILETENEAKILAAALAHASDDSEDTDAGDFLYKIYRSLVGVVPKWGEAYACNGELTVTKR